MFFSEALDRAISEHDSMSSSVTGDSASINSSSTAGGGVAGTQSEPTEQRMPADGAPCAAGPGACASPSAKVYASVADMKKKQANGRQQVRTVLNKLVSLLLRAHLDYMTQPIPTLQPPSFPIPETPLLILS